MFGLHAVFVQKQMKPYQSRTIALQPTYKCKKEKKIRNEECNYSFELCA